MGKKNWIEFNSQKINSQETSRLNGSSEISKIKIFKQKKCKKGKTITLIQGLGVDDETQIRELLKKMKVFCGTGGTLIDHDIQLQGDMVLKSIHFLRKEGFQNL